MATETIDLAQSFYECDEVSQMKPGCKDILSQESRRTSTCSEEADIEQFEGDISIV